MGVVVPVQWSETMRTGVGEIDQQHRILVDTLASAHARLPNTASGPLFDELTRDLLAYAIYHFETEEELMRRHGFPSASPDAAAAHLSQHRFFSERVVALRTEAREGRASREALLAFLTDWLMNHILTSDKQLGAYIQSTRGA